MIAIEALEELAKTAGREIRRVYETKSYHLEVKEDQSPLTEADLSSNRIITQGLKIFGDIPYISEEETPKIIHPIPQRYWLIDPLDGTKEFVKRRKAFTVNIALIEDGVPTVAVVYEPLEDRLYSAHYGIYREDGVPQAKTKAWPDGYTLVSSHSHPEAELERFIACHSITEHLRIGSSLKFCLVAERKAHIYPRFRALKAWDTAAGDGVARAAGCRVVDWKTGKAPVYAYDKAWTEAFYIAASDREFPLVNTSGHSE